MVGYEFNPLREGAVVVGILDQPPGYVREDLERLSAALDQAPALGGIPEKDPCTLLVGTWNIRHLGDLTTKWRSTTGDTPTRDVRSCRFIAEILHRFDVVALQEIKRNTRALREIMLWLNRDESDRWKVLVTDVTKGSTGNNERLGYLYDSHKLQASGLAAELVVPPDDPNLSITAGALQNQFARTPYAASFRFQQQSFILVTLHVLYGDQPANREPELRAIADWLEDWADDDHIWENSDVLALGDFNIDRQHDPRWQAFVSGRLQVPTELNDVPRSVFDDADDPSKKFYDQIAWFTGDDGGPSIRLRYTNRAGSFDFMAPLRFDGMTTKSRSYRLSDHYPLWVEFRCD